MRVLVCGGRRYTNRAVVYANLDAIHRATPITCIIEGGQTGADMLARFWAQDRGVQFTEYPADWEAHDLAAGPIRNQRMLDEGKPDLVIAFPGHNGTANMVARARKARVRIKDLRYVR